MDDNFQPEENDQEYIDTVEGEIVQTGSESLEDMDRQAAQDFWDKSRYEVLNDFGDLLKHIRDQLSIKLGHVITQAEFGELLGHTSNVTISRWENGTNRPQPELITRIVEVAQEHGLSGITVDRLNRSLNRAQEDYKGLDPGLRRIELLLSTEDQAFRDNFYEIAIALIKMLKGIASGGKM